MTHQPHRQKIGKWGEAFAARYLEERGYSILLRNVRTPYGEIDLIASQETRVVFVEVKTRTSQSYGLPEAAITARKLAHMIDSAQYYMEEHPDQAGQGWQIDVISIFGRPRDARDNVDIQHFENVAS
jgi:putative endonuclease